MCGVIVLFFIIIAAGCNKPVTNNAPQNPTQANGYESFKGYCLSCHKVNGEGGSKGPDLSKIGAYRNKEWLAKWIRNPKSIKPNTKMPTLNLSEKRIEDISEYLSSLK